MTHRWAARMSSALAALPLLTTGACDAPESSRGSLPPVQNARLPDRAPAPDRDAVQPGNAGPFTLAGSHDRGRRSNAAALAPEKPKAPQPEGFARSEPGVFVAARATPKSLPARPPDENRLAIGSNAARHGPAEETIEPKAVEKVDQPGGVIVADDRPRGGGRAGPLEDRRPFLVLASASPALVPSLADIPLSDQPALDLDIAPPDQGDLAGGRFAGPTGQPRPGSEPADTAGSEEPAAVLADKQTGDLPQASDKHRGSLDTARVAATPARAGARPEPGPDPRVDIAQITASERTAYVAQLTREQGSAQLAVRQGGEIIGALQFQVSDGGIAVHIGQVLDLFEARMDTARFAALRGSRAAETFVSLDRLRDAGVPLVYSAAYDELVLADLPG